MFMLYNVIYQLQLHFSYNIYLNIQVAKNEELGLELVTLLNTKEKLQHDKEAVELETMQVIIMFIYKLQFVAQNLLFKTWGYSPKKLDVRVSCFVKP